MKITNRDGRRKATVDRGRTYRTGDLEGIAAVLKVRLAEFFDTPLPTRIREVPALIGHTDEKEAEQIRHKCERLAEVFEGTTFRVEDDLLVEEFDIALAGKLTDDQIQFHLCAAFRALLYQLLMEALLGYPDDLLRPQPSLRRKWGIEGESRSDLADEILRMFDGPIKRRFDSPPPGRPEEKEGLVSEEVQEHYRHIYQQVKPLSAERKKFRSKSAWKRHLRERGAKDYKLDLDILTHYLELEDKWLSKNDAVIAREITRRQHGLPAWSDRKLRREFGLTVLAKNRVN
jgi:hypothetical protein